MRGEEVSVVAARTEYARCVRAAVSNSASQIRTVVVKVPQFRGAPHILDAELRRRQAQVFPRPVHWLPLPRLVYEGIVLGEELEEGADASDVRVLRRPLATGRCEEEDGKEKEEHVRLHAASQGRPWRMAMM